MTTSSKTNKIKELKEIKEEYYKRFFPQVDETFGVQLWDWFEQKLIQVREEGFKEGYQDGWNDSSHNVKHD